MGNSRTLRNRLISTTLPAIFTLLLAASASSQEAANNGKKKVFTEDDARVEKVPGRWTLSTAPDLKLVNDASVPVAVTTVRTFYGQGRYLGRIKVLEAKIQNRATKATQSVRLRWQIVNLDEPDKVLLEGFTPEFEARVEAHGDLQMDNIPTIYFNKIVRPLMRGGELSGTLRLLVAVQEVRFADGTVWTNNPQTAFVRASFARTPAAPWSQYLVPTVFLKPPPSFGAKTPAADLSPCSEPGGLRAASGPLSLFQSNPPCKSNYAGDYDPVANKNYCRPDTGLWCDLDGCDSEGHCSATTGSGVCPGCGPCTTDPGYSEISAERCGEGLHWACISCKCVYNSPVLIDVLGDGFDLTDFAGGVNFNFDGDGPIPSSWTAAGSDDAFLVLDRNGNGAVDAGWELFGNVTPQPAPPAGVEPNGFIALAEYDRAINGGNGDGVLDSRDAIFNALRLWRDTNHNGVSEAGELHALPALGVESLSVDYRESRKKDRYGNQFRYRVKVNGQGRSEAGKWAYDVFFLSKP